MSIFSSNNSYLGVDIGTYSIKIVELKKEKGKMRLLTYGFNESSQVLSDIGNKQLSNIINKICQRSGAVSKNAVAALPTFSVFSSIINLTGVNKKDMPSAVRWQAKKVMPIPLEEIILDWRQLKGEEVKNIESREDVRVLLTGAPRSLISKYNEIFKASQINLLSLETETFSLVRSLLGNDKSTVMIVEMGANTTDISIIDNGIPALTRSINVGGTTITKAISNNLNIGMERAEQFKCDLGVASFESQKNDMPELIAETVSAVVNEIRYAINLFQDKNKIKVEKIILSGGSALLVNFSSYLSKKLDMNVIIGNPWDRISYPIDLKPVLDEVGPRMSIAIGLAMRELE